MLGIQPRSSARATSALQWAISPAPNFCSSQITQTMVIHQLIQITKCCPPDCLFSRQNILTSEAEASCSLQIGARVGKRRKTSAIGCALYWFGTWCHHTFVKNNNNMKESRARNVPRWEAGQSYHLHGKTHFKLSLQKFTTDDFKGKWTHDSKNSLNLWGNKLTSVRKRGKT